MPKTVMYNLKVVNGRKNCVYHPRISRHGEGGKGRLSWSPLPTLELGSPT